MKDIVTFNALSGWGAYCALFYFGCDQKETFAQIFCKKGEPFLSISLEFK
jgi:hypothetical protein